MRGFADQAWFQEPKVRKSSLGECMEELYAFWDREGRPRLSVANRESLQRLPTKNEPPRDSSNQCLAIVAYSPFIRLTNGPVRTRFKAVNR